MRLAAILHLSRQQISVIQICIFYRVVHDALTLPSSSPSSYILLVLLVSAVPPRIVLVVAAFVGILILVAIEVVEYIALVGLHSLVLQYG
jgi:hypothetical protein